MDIENIWKGYKNLDLDNLESIVYEFIIKAKSVEEELEQSTEKIETLEKELEEANERIDELEKTIEELEG